MHQHDPPRHHVGKDEVIPRKTTPDSDGKGEAAAQSAAATAGELANAT